MKLPEHQAKDILAARGIRIPKGSVVDSVDGARAAATEAGGAVVVKVQVKSGGRGKAGGVVVVDSPDRAAEEAERLLGSVFADEVVKELLIEEAIDIDHERYLAVTIDPSLGRPVVMASDQGGVEIESMTDAIERTVVPPQGQLTLDDSVDAADTAIIETLVDTFRDLDAVLVEINPLAVTSTGELIALDAKIELDDAASFRRDGAITELVGTDDPETLAGTEREQAAAAMGLRLIELGGDVAILANGAGLTMATMDAIAHAGGAPANFLEIGGDAYTKATPALELVLAQPGVRSLLVNFCGAFARCDVMTAGVIEAWKALSPTIPVAFSISGTGQDEARAMVRNELGMEPHDTMADAVEAAVAAGANA